MQGVGPPAPTTIPHLDEAEPQLGAELDGEAPDLDPHDNPGPVQPKDTGLASCVCLAYNACMESFLCPMASSKSQKISGHLFADFEL